VEVTRRGPLLAHCVFENAGIHEFILECTHDRPSGREPVATRLAPRKVLTAVPSSDSIPASPCPPAFLPSETREHAHSPLDRRAVVSDLAGCTRLFSSARRARFSSRSEPSNSASISRVYDASQKRRCRAPTASDIPINNAQRKLNSLLASSEVQPSAGLPSSHSFHGEVFSCGRLLLSIPLVQLCPAHKPKTAPCSLPRPQAPLRSGD